MPGAGDNALLNPAIAQRRAHVRAAVVDGVVASPVKEQGDQLLAHDDGLAFALPDFADATDRMEFGHECPRWKACIVAAIILAAGHTICDQPAAPARSDLPARTVVGTLRVPKPRHTECADSFPACVVVRVAWSKSNRSSATWISPFSNAGSASWARSRASSARKPITTSTPPTATLPAPMKRCASAASARPIA